MPQKPTCLSEDRGLNLATQQLTPKQRILQTVDRLFYQQGYSATGINQIIAEAQVAKASFYQHFDSKEALLLEYLQAYNCSLFEQLKSGARPCAEPRAKVLGLFDLLADFTRNTECRGCAFLNIAAEFSDPQSKPRQLIAQLKADLKLYIEQLVIPALPHSIAPQIARTKATAVYLLFEAALIESRVHNAMWCVEASKAAVEQLLN